jgi:hypothetical protein
LQVGIQAGEDEEQMLLERNNQTHSPTNVANPEEDYGAETQPQHPERKKRTHRATTSGKKKKASSSKKLSDSIDVDVENLSDFDIGTVVQCAMGLTNRALMLRRVKKWLLDRNEVKKSVPNLKNIQKMTNEQVLHK